MKIQPEKIHAIVKEIEDIISTLKTAELNNNEAISQVHPSFKKGAVNLVHYRTFRSLELNKLQKQLSNFGLTLLESTESHVMATLLTARRLLLALIQDETDFSPPKRTSIKSSVKQQKKHAKDLFGFRSKGRRVRIMLTLPTDAAYNYELLHNLVASGMNIARINCAHDNPEIWALMIQNLKRANEELHKKCKIFMDLAGPKIRTGSLGEGVKVRKFRPTRNELGQVIQPAQIVLVSDQISCSPSELPVNAHWLNSLKVGEQIRLVDTRKKRRKLIVKSVSKDRVLLTCKKTSYIRTGTKLTSLLTKNKCTVGEIKGIEQSIILRKKEFLRVVKEQHQVKPIELNEHGEVLSPASISCTAPEIFEAVKKGEKILFDDGKIEGIIRNTTATDFLVEITQAKAGGTKLRADKGINLPDSNLQSWGMSARDKEDLDFIVKHADGVNVSFVKSADYVAELYTELDRLGAKADFGIVLKIENQSAYKNLSHILLQGMKRYPLGVMIARGDLAIEAGWANMPRIQNEILRLCDSAFVPTVWATQVLENMAKKGIPSRSELTDVASSLKADCVMLNKGDYILEALQLLHKILSGMNSYRDKDVRLYEAIEAHSRL